MGEITCNGVYNMNKKDHLIDDSGMHKDMRTIQSRIFIGICHTLSVIVGILGILAWVKGNM